MSSQIQITGETKVKSLTGVLVGTSGVVSSLNIDGSLGIPQLDVNGKIIVSQLPNSVMEYKGVWNAATNSPTLTNGGAFNQGDVYLCDTAGTVNFGAGPIAFVVSDQVIYSGSIWQKASGTNGTVTSVGLSTNAGAITIGSSPITTSGTITANFNGTNLQYVNGAGNLTTFPILTGYVTAVSGTAPVVSSGGTTPAISMAAATGSVDGYLSATDFAIFNAKQSALTFSSPLVNTSGTISIPAATTSVNGYLASADFTTFNNKQNAITLTTTGSSGVSTLVGATLNIPNYSSALTGYVPYTGATQDVDLGAFKLNAQSLHIKGTAGNGHLGLKHQSASATASANEVSLFADSLGDLSWQNANLYLSKFITSANTANRSYTFPNANGTVALTSDLANYVDLTTAQTIGGTKTFSDATKNNGGIFLQNASSNSLAGYMNIGGLTNGVKFTSGGGISNTFTLPSATGYTFTFDAITGSIAMLEGTQTFTGAKTFDAAYFNGAEFINTAYFDKGLWLVKNGIPSVFTALQTTIYSESTSNNVIFRDNISKAKLIFNNSTQTFTFPAATGTIALTSDLTGGTVTSVAALTIGTSGTDLSSSVANSTTTPVITLNVPTASATNRGALSSSDFTTFNSKQGTITLTTTGTSGAATFSSNTLNIPNYGSALSGYLPLTGGTLTGALSGTSAVFTTTANIGSTYRNNTQWGTNLMVKSTSNGIVLEAPSTSDNALIFSHNGTAGIIRTSYYSSGAHTPLILQTSDIDRLTIASTGAATFSSSVQSTSILIGSGGTYGTLSWVSGNFGFNYPLYSTGTITATNSVDADISLSFSAAGAATKYGSIQSSVSGRALALNPTNGGNVLIGTTTDSGYKLDVNGTGRFSGTVTGNTSNAFYVNAISGNSYISYGLNGTTNAYTGLAGSAGAIVAGTSTGDLVLRTEGYNMFLGTNSNTSWALKLTASTGAATFSSLAGVGSRTVNASATGELSAASDSRLKQEDLDYKVEGLAEILQIQPRAYKWLSDIDNRGENATTEIGFFANEIASIIPSAAPMGNDGYYGFYDRAVIAALVKGIQEQQKQIEELRKIVATINK